MKRIELVRWGVPLIAFVVVFERFGMTAAAVLSAVVLATISGLIFWHRKDPDGFLVVMRVLIVLLLVLPSGALLLLVAMSSKSFLPFAMAPLMFAFWLLSRSTKTPETIQPGEEMSAQGPVMGGAMRNLHGRHALNNLAAANDRTHSSRQRVYQLQAENLDLIRENSLLKAELDELKGGAQPKIPAHLAALNEIEDPFADDIPLPRSP